MPNDNIERAIRRGTVHAGKLPATKIWFMELMLRRHIDYRCRNE